MRVCWPVGPAELGVLCGFDHDLAARITAGSDRIRGLLTQIHPALERALGAHLDPSWPTRARPGGSNHRLFRVGTSWSFDSISIEFRFNVQNPLGATGNIRLN